MPSTSAKPALVQVRRKAVFYEKVAVICEIRDGLGVSEDTVHALQSGTSAIVFSGDNLRNGSPTVKAETEELDAAGFVLSSTRRASRMTEGVMAEVTTVLQEMLSTMCPSVAQCIGGLPNCDNELWHSVTHRRGVMQLYRRLLEHLVDEERDCHRPGDISA
ncbi:hypothetical protein ERJ75_000502700 [Trypanosoma vivax]|nr:hypothetical protein ERJ75_000855100 [Trypanosoma vivax]KAH8616212.1 hypothetical protein ERJ75_000502700 [Trypanosoma vivax]